MHLRPLMVLAAFFLLVAAGCDDSTTGATPCTTDQNCPIGSLCLNEVCAAVACSTAGDCFSASHVCIEVTPGAGKVCSAPECGCATCAACPTGEVCTLGQCVEDTGPPPCTGICPGDACTTDAECKTGTEKCAQGACWPASACFANTDCAETEVCEDNGCRPCAGDECSTPIEDCTTLGCADGETCNTATGVCDPIVSTNGEQCATCSAAADCPAGWSCTPLASGKACLKPCTTNNECGTGWSCQGTPSICTPDGFRCDGCVTDGCTDPQVCNTINQKCEASRALCEPCTFGWECGPDAACIRLDSGQRVCKPRCSGAEDCPASACGMDADSGLQVCDSVGGECCYAATAQECGPVSECNPACGGATPFCVDSGCVQCTNDTHCPPETTCNAGGTCQGENQECLPPTPYLWNGQCVECLNNTQCTTGFCASATKSCEEGGDVCDSCDGSYPACTEVGGEFFCVPCTDDSFCGAGCTCNLQTFTCDGDCTSDTIDKCESDADCDPGITAFNLKCDTVSGLCYDVTGGCDDITAFCRGGGKCSNIFEAFLGGGAGGLGDFFDLLGGIGGGGGATIPGACECDPLVELVAGGEGVCGGTLCFGIAALLGIPDSPSICFNLGP